MAEIWRVCVNEWTKLIRRKRLWIASILALLLVALFSYATYHDAQNQARFNSPAHTEQQIQVTQREITSVKAQPSTAQTKQELQQLQAQLTSLQQQYKSQKAEEVGNWKPTVQKQIANMNQQLKSLGTTPQDKVTAAELHQGLLTANYEVKNNVAPTPPWVTSPYNSLHQFLSVVSAVFLPLLIVIMVADMMAGESTTGTIKLLLIRPVSRTKILLGKWFVSLFATVLLTLASCFAMLGGGIAVAGNHGALQPQLVGVTYKFIEATGIVSNGQNGLQAVPQLVNAHILPAWVFTVDSILLITLAMLVVTTISFLCSILFKSAMASTAVALGVIIIGNIAENFTHSKWLILWFPLHLDLTSDWTGAISRQLQMNTGLTVGLLVMAGWIVAAMIVSLVKFNKQDILNA